MPLITLDHVSLAYGHHPLLDRVGLVIEPGERVCLLGRNGEGKSTLLKLIAGELQPDEGEVWRQPTARIARLRQEVPAADTRSVYEVVAEGLGEQARLLADYHRLASQVSASPDEAAMRALARLQHQLEAVDGWNLQQRVESVISKLELPAEQRIDALSGGWRRRALLGQALVMAPDLLLLDEPTNHLDIAAITWLEEFLLKQNCGLVFVTHDRAFLRRLATRIIELDRGRLTSWPGDYATYLRRKEEQLAAQEQQQALFDKRLAQEESWIRQGIKARRTRNEGRVRRLQAMREQRRARRERTGVANMNLSAGEASGKRVFEAEHVWFSWEGEYLIRDFSCTILRGDKIGLVGPNGSGKSSLLQILLGQLQPERGRVYRGTRLEIAYFDQQREQLDLEATVLDNLSEGREFIEVEGRRRHVAGYLRDFLFEPERLRSPVKTLSGGERNRLLLAKLFTRSANVLILDEPTNDLDLETLELLEDLLVDYGGTLLLVSHDRAFLDNVVTSTLVFEGDGVIEEYVGGYQDYLRQRRPPAEAREAAPARSGTIPTKQADSRRRRKLGYKEQRELAELPERIEALEAEQRQLQQQTADPAFYQGEKHEISCVMARLGELEQELEQAYARWEVLESREAE